MSKLLATTTLAKPNPEPRDRRVSSARAAQPPAVEQGRAAMLSPAGLDVLVFLARLLGRQEGREPLEALQAGQGQVLDPAQVEPPAEFLSVQEAAAYAKVSTQTVRRWVKAGDLKTHRAGRQIRIDKSALVHFMSL